MAAHLYERSVHSAYGYRTDAYGYRTDAYGYRTDAYGYRTDAYGYRTDAYGYRMDAYGYRMAAMIRVGLLIRVCFEFSLTLLPIEDAMLQALADGTRNVSDSIRGLLAGPELLRCLAPSERELSFLGALLGGDSPNAFLDAAATPAPGSSSSPLAGSGSGSHSEGPVSELERRGALAAVLRSVFLFLLVCTTLYVAADFLAQIAFLLFLRYLMQ